MRNGLPSFLRYRQQRGRDVHCLRRPGVPTFWVGVRLRQRMACGSQCCSAR